MCVVIGGAELRFVNAISGSGAGDSADRPPAARLRGRRGMPLANHPLVPRKWAGARGGPRFRWIFANLEAPPDGPAAGNSQCPMSIVDGVTDTVGPK